MSNQSATRWAWAMVEPADFGEGIREAWVLGVPLHDDQQITGIRAVVYRREGDGRVWFEARHGGQASGPGVADTIEMGMKMARDELFKFVQAMDSLLLE